ncbi:hypothetical protein [Psychroserpens algicola]|uniref:hypothetical protein n=1 Tax=Psychroserpens algicola TaxID=1719034 RepID=UPI0019541633|nr:hypothetical protein [Psychroserpens algicola]
MKKALVLMMIFTAFMSCKDDQKKEADITSEEKTVVAKEGKTIKQSDGNIAIHGKFLFDKANNAAVLLTPNQMYGIVINDQAEALNAQVEPYKEDQYTMVPVTIRGRIFKNEGSKDEWEHKIEIKEILKVSEPESEDKDVIKLGSK